MKSTPLEQDKEKLETLIACLQSFKEKISVLDYIQQRESFFKVMTEFREYLSSVNDLYLCDLFFHSKRYAEFESFFREKNYYYLRAMEASESLGIISQGNHVGSFSSLLEKDHFRDNYSNRGNDFLGCRIDSEDIIMCIGCGPMPETMIYIYEHFKPKKIIGIDNNYEAIYIAGDLLTNLALQNIEIKYADGLEYDYKDIDVVYIPAFVSPKNDIIKRITNTSKDTVKIIVEQSKYLTRMLYDTVSLELHPRLRVRSLIEGEKNKYIKRDIITLEKYDY